MATSVTAFSKNTFLGFTITLVCISGHFALGAEVFPVPGFCNPSELVATLDNSTSSAQRVWTQTHLEGQVQEVFYELPVRTKMKFAAESLELPLNPDGSSRRGFSLKSYEKNKVKGTAYCPGHVSVPLSSLTSPEVAHPLPQGVANVDIHILNLFVNPQKIQLKAVAQSGVVLATTELQIEKYYDTKFLSWSLPPGVRRIEVVGEQRLQSWLFYPGKTEKQFSPAMSLRPRQLAANPAKTYFLVSTQESRPEESFVVGIEDLDHIAVAREQIRNPQLAKILVARISLGHGEHNRSFSSKDRAPYSWSVSEVDAFTDFAHISCDGSPELTEERLLEKLNEGGRICFWRYRIVKELSVLEVSSGQLRQP